MATSVKETTEKKNVSKLESKSGNEWWKKKSSKRQISRAAYKITENTLS